MAVSVKEVHRAIAGRIDALSGYREVRMLPQYFGRTQNTLAHLGFAVDIVTSNAAAERQRRPIGAMLESLARVKIAYRIRPHDVVLDYGNALDKEQEVIAALIFSIDAVRFFSLTSTGFAPAASADNLYIKKPCSV